MSGQSFLSDVERAIDRVIQTRPELFDLNDTPCRGCPRVLDRATYLNAVLSTLSSFGYCAIYDGLEVAVKNNNSFNDQFNILTSSNYVRRGEGSYRSTCRPAWF
jgi:hypothetical protein